MYCGHRHPVIAPEVTNLSFYATLFVAFARCAELRLVLPVRTKGDEASRLLSLIAAQNLLHCARQVVVTKPPKDATEIMKCQLVCLQKCLLRGSQIGAMKGRATGHRTHREPLQLALFSPQLCPGFIPVALRLDAPLVALRHKGLAPEQSQCLLATFHVLSHRSFRCRTLRNLHSDAFVDAMRGVPLFARGLAVCLQNRVDQGCRRSHLQCRTLGLLPPRRHCAPDRFPHHPPVHAQLPRHALNRPCSELIL